MKVRRHEQFVNFKVGSYEDWKKNMTRKNDNATGTEQVMSKGTISGP